MAVAVVGRSGQCTRTSGGVPSVWITTGTTTTTVQATTALPLSTWSFVAATYDGATLRISVPRPMRIGLSQQVSQ